MVFPLEQLVEFDGNIYEITVAASLRAYQMAKVNDPEIAANQDKVVCVAANPGACNVFTNKGEFGWDGWLGPYVSVDPENKITFVMTMQRCDSGTTTAARRVQNILYSAL